ncbi:hypothetical protein CVT24_003968 [Panaeolus cyanescens]|uniref:DASH complex subunit DUO1 n=1 Tax=Panaeolus cyanescens TaxID=181874 RepID=A0A409Y6F7_9AGAR|nr:hypothetical protein CVT24_003968 [Panaeolus cyanescens]
MSITDSFDTADLSEHGSHLLSLPSPSIPSEHSHSRDEDHRDDDLSFSELFISQPGQPFSLLAKPKVEDKELQEDVEDEVKRSESSLQKAEERNEQIQQEKLQSDLFILKKLNAAFESFNEALRGTHTANERIAAQLEQTDALLNKYINILSKSEDVSRLIFDEGWQGAEADEKLIEEERQKALEKAQREAEEERRRIERERERIQKEKEAEAKRLEKERVEREKTERAGSRGYRGVRGVGSSRGTGTKTTTRTTTSTTSTTTRGTASARSGRPSALPRPIT